jgi:hypothetical protein
MLSKLDKTRFKTKKLKTIELKFKKNANVGESNIYQIPVKTCQEYIHHKESKLEFSAIK